jgi:iron-sulfur cluster repair protein YtfE (RIC family)
MHPPPTDTNAAPTDGATLPELTLHEIVRRLPGSRDILLGHGLDLCCGGELPLREAARLHGLDLEVLLEALIGS